MIDLVEKMADEVLKIRDGLDVRYPDPKGGLVVFTPLQMAIGRVYGVTGGWFPVTNIGNVNIVACRFACLACDLGAEVYLGLGETPSDDDSQNMMRSAEIGMVRTAALPPFNCEHAGALGTIMQAMANPDYGDIRKALGLLGLELRADYAMSGIDRESAINGITENVMANLNKVFLAVDKKRENNAPNPN